jgi:AcrR family transcriptional regulator
MMDTRLKRKTQAQRRAESSNAVLASAIRLFGDKGYANTSLEDIAADCGLTIRPIYHYFGNKKSLFAAVNEAMETRILESMSIGEDGRPGAGITANWRAYLNLCDDPGFRQIVLIDSPNILGRERWATSPVSEKARKSLAPAGAAPKELQFRAKLVSRVVMASFTEAALMIAEAEDIPRAKREAEELMVELFSTLQSHAAQS